MNQQIEEWRPVSGHPGYEVSNIGRIRSLSRACHYVTKRGTVVVRHAAGVIRTPGVKPNGYLYMPLGSNKVVHVHRVVAIAFITGDTTLTVNHIDGDKTNNVVSNLEWATQSENNFHAYKCLGKKPGYKPVLVDGVAFESLTSAAVHFGVRVTQVSNAAKRGHKLHGMVVQRV